jgi:hypothetical protein
MGYSGTILFSGHHTGKGAYWECSTDANTEIGSLFGKLNKLKYLEKPQNRR